MLYPTALEAVTQEHIVVLRISTCMVVLHAAKVDRRARLVMQWSRRFLKSSAGSYGGFRYFTNETEVYSASSDVALGGRGSFLRCS